MTQSLEPIPPTAYAIQLVGPDKLVLNTAKPVPTPGPTQVLVRIEAVGLCFSDLKLLKQFDAHPRKMPIETGIEQSILDEIPSYVPGEKPTVPGHEGVCRIVAIGDQVTRYKLGERVLIQTDYRTLLTAGGNASFGYNFEGALQEYVIMDERIIIQPGTGERFLLPASEELSASAIGLVEPWACVENSYATAERRTVKAGGQLLVVVDSQRRIKGIEDAFSPDGPPETIAAVCSEESQFVALEAIGAESLEIENLEALPSEAFDDIIYFGADPSTIEVLNDKLAAHGIINIVLGGYGIGRPAEIGVGRVHYGMTRWIGTTGMDCSESYKHIPENGEVRDGDRVLVIGAGGPMGQMHVIRNICSGKAGVSVVAADVDDTRLTSLVQKSKKMAEANKVAVKAVNTKSTALAEGFTYVGLMAPVGALLASSILLAGDGCLINVFAGIPQPTKHPIDLDVYIERHCYMFGTSGSTITDMKTILRKVEARQLDTNFSVDAVTGMAGAADGIKAVENRTLAGKIIVYPGLHELGLTPLEQLAEKFPTVAAKLDGGQWTLEAEQELLKVAK